MRSLRILGISLLIAGLGAGCGIPKEQHQKTLDELKSLRADMAAQEKACTEAKAVNALRLIVARMSRVWCQLVGCVRARPSDDGTIAEVEMQKRWRGCLTRRGRAPELKGNVPRSSPTSRKRHLLAVVSCHEVPNEISWTPWPRSDASWWPAELSP